MSDRWTERATYNNAVWCDAVCRAASSPGRFEEGIWINPSKAPPFYPNAVTLSADETASQSDAIRRLLKTGIDGPWAVKDSFCRLDLAPLGFRVLFEAQWMVSRPGQQDGAEDIPGCSWRRASDVQALADWERAWQNDPANRTDSSQVIFGPSLLDDPDIAFIAGYRDSGIVAGAVANRAGGVVGLSNLFTPLVDEAKYRVACLREVVKAFPGLPLAGYENDEDFPVWKALGFEAAGRLRVWVTLV